MSFADAARKEKPKWETVATLGEIKKNKSDTLKITTAKFAGNDLVNFQVWRTNPETEETYPLKEQKVSFNIDLVDQILEALAKANVSD